MNPYITGSTIKQLREKNHITQAELALKLNVSDKAVSKWETGKGYPDISLLEPISNVFGVSLTELLSGNTISNMNVSANMLRSNFYVCPICGNVIHSMGELTVCCHGIQLLPQEPEKANESHNISITTVEDEYFVEVDHEMTKNHFISFIASLSFDGLQLYKLYPEGNTNCRIKIRGTKRIYFYCNKDGLFYYDIDKK